MDEDCGKTYGIEKLAELLIERGIEFFVKDEVSLAFKDDVGNWHECWMAGADENRVNALIVVTPEQLLSVPDLNGIIAENAKLRELCADMWRDIPKTESCGWDMSANICTGYDECHGECALWYRMHDLGIEA
jgi:hypothetical protein